MALYLISYDVIKEDSHEYGPLWAKLEAIGARKILFSEWVVVGDVGSAAAFYSAIAPLMTLKDRLLVQEVRRDAIWDKLLITDAEFQTLLTHARG